VVTGVPEELDGGKEELKDVISDTWVLGTLVDSRRRKHERSLRPFLVTEGLGVRAQARGSGCISLIAIAANLCHSRV